MWLAAGFIALATLVAYHNTFAVPFVFDDVPAIVENTSIRDLGALGRVLFPDQAGGLTTSGRPLVNLSLALNHAISGDRVWSYHAFNLAIHLAAALCLFGLVRRTLLVPRLASRFGSHATPLAAAIAALWALHPLQTESVTYVVQRAEALAGLFYLLTLYCATRGLNEANGGRWRAAALAACALGMASKEVMVSAPLLVLLYDRTFMSDTFAAAWRARRRFYVALVATWLVLIALMASTGGRGGTAGFSTDISAWTYLLTQARALMHYLVLTFWPASLVFDHGLATARNLSEVLPQGLVVIALLGATVLALRRWPGLGFLGAFLFAVLAPSSSFVPIVTQTVAEHRMYLALAPVLALLVLGLHCVFPRVALVFAGAAAVALGAATIARNADYRSELTLWADTAAKLPTNARAHNNLGQALYRAGRITDAIARYREALRLQPKYPETHYNLGVALAHQGELDRAIEHYETALRFEPVYPEALNNLGNALVRAGRLEDALRRYEEALRHRPDFAEAHNNLGNALLQAGRTSEARTHFERAQRLRPADAESLYNLGNVFAATGDMTGALERYRAALRLNPRYAAAHVNAGNALLELKRPVEALTHYEAAIAADAALPDAHFNRGSVLLDLQRWGEAIGAFEALLRVKPDAIDAHRALGFALAQAGRRADAISHYERYLALRPDDTAARAELAQLRR